MSYCSRSCRRWFILLDFKSSAFCRICGHCQQHFTAHMQKRLFRKFRYNRRFDYVFRWFFLHFICWISFASRPRFPYKVRNFGDLETFSIDCCILYAESSPYFYFRFFIFTNCAKFEVDMAIHCRVIAFLLLIRCVTLWPWLLTFWPWPALIHER